MSADLLRRAATKIRETAQAATPGPWRTTQGGLTDPRGANVAAFGGTDVVADCCGYQGGASVPDAAHIALWSPDVAEDVATVLEDVAAGIGRRGVTARLSAAERMATALARRILGEDS